jgi:hypothetical protein
MLRHRWAWAKARIRRVGEQLLLHQASTTEQPRPDRTNGNAEDFGGRFVRLVFYIHNNQSGAKWFRDLAEGLADGRTEIEAGKHFLEPVLGSERVQRANSRRVNLRRVQLDGGACAFARTQEHVSANGE